MGEHCGGQPETGLAGQGAGRHSEGAAAYGLESAGTGVDAEYAPERAVARAVASTGTGVDTGWIRRAFGVTEPELERMVDAAGAGAGPR